MEDHSGDIYLWNGQEIINYQPRNCKHNSLTNTAPRKRFARIVHLNGKQSELIKAISKLESIYLLGGKIGEEGPTNQVGCYSLRLNIWWHAPPMKDSRICLSAVAGSDDTIVVCGGLHSDWDISSCEIFSASCQR